MGVYLRPTIINETGDVLHYFPTLKGSAGVVTYMYTKKDLYFKKGEYLYYKVPVKKAIATLQTFLKEIKSIDVPLDEWSYRASQIVGDIEIAITILTKYQDETCFIYTDETEYVGLYDDKEDVPSGTDGENARDSLRAVVKGYYNGFYPSQEQEEMQREEKEVLVTALKKESGMKKIEYFGSNYDSQHVVVSANLQEKLHIVPIKVHFEAEEMTSLDDSRLQIKIKNLRDNMKRQGYETLDYNLRKPTEEEIKEAYRMHPENKLTEVKHDEEGNVVVYLYSEQQDISTFVYPIMEKFGAVVHTLNHYQTLSFEKPMYVTRMVYTTDISASHTWTDDAFKIEQLKMKAELRKHGIGMQFRWYGSRIFEYEDTSFLFHFIKKLGQ